MKGFAVTLFVVLIVLSGAPPLALAVIGLAIVLMVLEK